MDFEFEMASRPAILDLHFQATVLIRVVEETKAKHSQMNIKT
jgi:hypothetical protein